MLKKVKKALGIEGVKIKILVPAQSPRSSQVIRGHVYITSLSDNVVEHIDLKIIERYSRGRKKDRLVNDYTLGTFTIDGPIVVEPNEEVQVAFTLPYVLAHSDMDRLGQNILTSGLVSLAKMLKKVSSTHRIVAEAKVKGTKLHPFDESPVELIGKG